MRIAILQTDGTAMSCIQALRMVAQLKRIAPAVDIIVGVAPDTPAMAFYENYQTDDFEYRAATLVTMTGLEYRRVYKKPTDAEQVYRFADGGGDFKDVDGMILCSPASGAFATFFPYMLILSEPASAVHQLEPEVLIGYFETIRNAQSVIYSNRRNQQNWATYALDALDNTTHQSLPCLGIDTLTKLPFQRVGAPYIAYFTAERSSSLIAGHMPNACFIISLPNEKADREVTTKRWNLQDALLAAEEISPHPFQVGNLIRDAEIVLIEHMEDKHDPCISAAHHFKRPLMMLLDDINDTILENVDITLGVKSRVKGQEIGQILLQVIKNIDLSQKPQKTAEAQTEDLDKTVLGFLASLEAAQGGARS